MTTAGSVRVRLARAGDRDFVMATARRLAAFEVPAWRRPDEIVDGEVRTLGEFFASAAPGCTLLVAEAEGEGPLGFAYLERVQDYFTLEEQGHLAILAVAEGAEGRGVGSLLLQSGEAWARERGYRRLTLNVFEKNARARALYDRLGYTVETLRYVKALGP
jgi:GNAT superfamily N-acetyltransferase